MQKEKVYSYYPNSYYTALPFLILSVGFLYLSFLQTDPFGMFLFVVFIIIVGALLIVILRMGILRKLIFITLFILVSIISTLIFGLKFNLAIAGLTGWLGVLVVVMVVKKTPVLILSPQGIRIGHYFGRKFLTVDKIAIIKFQSNIIPILFSYMPHFQQLDLIKVWDKNNHYYSVSVNDLNRHPDVIKNDVAEFSKANNIPFGLEKAEHEKYLDYFLKKPKVLFILLFILVGIVLILAYNDSIRVLLAKKP